MTQAHTADGLMASETAEVGPVPVEQPRRRLETIDLLRGLLMLLMAVDHARDFFGRVPVDATDPATSWPALYLTRWITHLCAPGFIALAGASVYIQRARGKPAGLMQRFLLTRGLWLLFLEVTVISFGWFFTTRGTVLQVIWTVSLCMMALAFLQRLRPAVVGGIGAAVLVLHNLLDPVRDSSFGRYSAVWDALHQSNFFFFDGHSTLLLYPVLPWIGVICAGYWFGALANAPLTPARRRSWTAGLSGVFFAAYACLRAMNHYGDRHHVQAFGSVNRDLMSFFEVQKYPPSLDYVLITFSALLLLYTLFDWLVEHDWLKRARGVVETYGRVPFFYYVLHLYLLHGMALLLALERGADWRVYTTVGGLAAPALPLAYGLPAVYGFWLLAVAILYWPCLWFSRLKARRRDWWLSYL